MTILVVPGWALREGGGELAPFQPSKQAEFAVKSVINHYSGDPSPESARAPCRLVLSPPLTSLPAGNSNAQNINLKRQNFQGPSPN